MLKGKLLLCSYSCSLSFLFGAAVGCVTAFLCSGDAVLRLYKSVALWQLSSGPCASMVACAVLTLCFLLLSFTVHGYLAVPLLDSVYGFCVSVECYSLLYVKGAVLQAFILSALIAMPAVPVLRLSAQCSALSLRVAQLIRSNGITGFDYHPYTRSIWLAMLLLFILFLLRCCVLSTLF